MAKSYYEEQIARARKTLADAAAGKGFAAAVKQLQDKSRIKDSLKDLPARGAIVSKRVIGRRVEAGGGIASPLVELAGSRTYYDDQTIDSSCGLFEFVYKPLRSLSLRDANGNAVVVIYDNPPP
jgi:hypothetical protein